MDLFDHQMNKNLQSSAPLADRLRPRSLDEFLGQEGIVGPGTLLRRAIEADDLPSMIFWGPPGSGKTTLASVIAKMTNSYFVELSGVTAGLKDLRAVVEEAKERRKYNNQRTILFVDEIHRWNKAQQDGLLPFVEKGIITLIGATTENPSFEVIAPLLSRSRVYVLKPLTPLNLKVIIDRALKDDSRGLGKYQAKIDKEAEDFLIKSSSGDARVILNALEVAAKNTRLDKSGQHVVDKKLIEEALQHKALQYDKAGDEHYNVISAFIKSLRGSSVDGALYWLARMVEAGEDPRFIARRMLILASEDIGNADPMALVVANAVFEAVDKIGWPEAQINLAQGVVYLAKAPKSNASYVALMKAKEDVKNTLNLPVPLHLRNAPTHLMKELGYGNNYKYSHDYSPEEGKQDYLPEELADHQYYFEK
ncbi:replication-associated recombination protein A [Candidatus Kuenenbacteria bacterium]|nr:replication-associated recombination protein A [Candidatus Kuenenbacteria bacterium]